jgi:subtilisin inhibitor-like
MRILLVVTIATAVAAAACGGTSSGGSSAPAATPAALTVTIQPGFVAHAHARTFRLTCAPAGGTLPHPAAACLALTRRPGLLEPFRRCPRVMPDLGRVQVAGVAGGRRVSLVFGCPQTVSRWRALAAALGVPAGGNGGLAR